MGLEVRERTSESSVKMPSGASMRKASISVSASECVTGEKDPRRMQTYVNNVQAQPYKFVTMESDAERLARHIDPNLPQGLIPDWAIALTLAVDMQRNHFWFSVAAHGLGAGADSYPRLWARPEL